MRNRIIGPLSLIISCAVLAQTQNATADAKSELLGQALGNDFNRWAKTQGILPKIQDGRVVAELPKAAKLLQYVVNDYKRRVQPDSLAVTYAIVAGIDDPGKAASAVGQFRQEGKPVATYLVSMGRGIVTAERAIVLVTILEKDGVHDVTSTLAWNEKTNEWQVERSEGPGPTPMEPQLVK